MKYNDPRVDKFKKHFWEFLKEGHPPRPATVLARDKAGISDSEVIALKRVLNGKR